MIRILVSNAHPRYRRRRAPVRSLVRSVLGDRRTGEIGVVFVNDSAMRSLNVKYLNHRYPTDVLSFPLSPPGSSLLEGELYINLDQARRQAAEYGVSLNNEVSRLVIHGLLHLLGYEDRTKAGKTRMTSAEDKWLSVIAKEGQG